MDDADRAQALIELELKIALSNRKTDLNETGLCQNNCGLIIGSGRYCSPECRSDHETIQRRKGEFK